jgi:GNAT superfamily N-acetyltransferase
MVRFRETPVADESAERLLGEYFASRELGFPASQGHYTPRYPTAEQFVPPLGIFLVVEEAGPYGATTDVGCGGIRRIESAVGSPARFEVKHLWLEPHARGRGYGRALLRELESRALEFGAQELVLDTNDSLTAAGGLYRSSGFVRIAPYNDNPNATSWYAKPLDGVSIRSLREHSTTGSTPREHSTNGSTPRGRSTTEGSASEAR